MATTFQNGDSSQRGERVDLSRITLQLIILDHLNEDAARRLQILPLRIESERLVVAMVEPDDDLTVGELTFIVGRPVVARAAEPGELREVIDAAYAAKRRGERTWTGARATAPQAPASSGPSEPARAERTPATPPDREPFNAELNYTANLSPIESQRTRPLILVVDDEPGIVRFIGESLAQRNYEVVGAADGGEALRLVKKRPPDAILLDAQLPDVHGFEICKRLKSGRRYQHIPIIMVTAIYKGWRMAADLKESYGVHATIEKPFEIHQIVKVLEEALRRSTDRPASDVLSAQAQRLYRDSVAAYRGGDLDAAAVALESAIGIDPLSATLRHHLGLLHGQRGDDFAAIHELEMAVDLDPGRFQTLRNLAVLYQKHGFRRKACEFWERALVEAKDEATQKEIRSILLRLL